MVAEGDSRVGTGGDEQVNVNIRCTDSSKYSVKTNLRSTVEEFKALLAHHCDVPVEQQRLIYKGRILKDDQTLISYGLHADHSVHMFRGSVPVATPPLPVLPATQVGLPPFVGLGTGGSPGLFGGGSQTNNSTPTNPTGDARTPSIAGFGGLGLPGMPVPDPSSFSQLLQNPAVTQMMQSLFPNPQYMDQIIGLNPQLRGMLDTNPQLREMMQNPDIIREVSSPATMQQMMAGQHLSQLSRQQSRLEGSQIGQDRAAGTPNNMGLGLLMNMFGGLGAGGLTAPNGSNVPPEEQYATQLSQLQEMGFFDTLENIRALRATSGNVHAAVERLLGNPGQ